MSEKTGVFPKTGVYAQMPHLKTKELRGRAYDWLDASYFGWEYLHPCETDYPGDLWWDDRIYIPIYPAVPDDDDDGAPISAVTRHYDDRKGVPKYLSGPLGGNDGLLLFPEGAHGIPAVITEGVFDAGAVAGSRAYVDPVCIFGVELRPAQIARLLELKVQEAIVLFDPDRISKALTAQWELESWGIRTVVASHMLENAFVLKKKPGEEDPKPDPANISPEYLKAVLEKARGKL